VAKPGRGKERRLTGHLATVKAVAFHPGGRAVASASADVTVRVWPFNGDAMFGKPPPPVVDADVVEAGTAPAANGTDFTNLFNGRDLNSWVGDMGIWSVQERMVRGAEERNIRGQTPGRLRNASCLFWQGEEMEDFELRFSFRLTGGNAGVHYRSRQLENFAPGGYQYDLAPGIDVGPDRTRDVSPSQAASQWLARRRDHRKRPAHRSPARRRNPVRDQLHGGEGAARWMDCAGNWRQHDRRVQRHSPETAPGR
jgi:hypothetical protein